MASLLLICSLATATGLLNQKPNDTHPSAIDEPQRSPDGPRHSGGKRGDGEGTRRALIWCGHPGTELYRRAYQQSVEKIYRALVDRWGFAAADVWVRFGVSSAPGEALKLPGCRGPATRQAMADDVVALKKSLAPNDTLWVIVIGHTHFDGRHVFLNLPGRDINQDGFGKLFEQLRCRQQVFFITVPASGFFIRSLSAKGRVVITATEADAEVNETWFHRHLAGVLDEPPEMPAADRDGDVRFTLLDLYLAVVRRVMMEYRQRELIPTEHALLDDNGDGQGTELQLDDLEPELGGRAIHRPLQVVIRPPGDGSLAASIVLEDRNKQNTNSDPENSEQEGTEPTAR